MMLTTTSLCFLVLLLLLLFCKWCLESRSPIMMAEEEAAAVPLFQPQRWGRGAGLLVL